MELKEIGSEIFTSEITIPELYQIFKSIVQEGANFIPALSGISNWVEHRNFKIRIEKNEEKLKKIFLFMPENRFEFIFTKITPLVFEKIIKDHEDDKVDLLLNGFENCIKNDITDYDEVLFYFDMISSLRVYEIKRLFSYYNINDENPIKIIEGTSEGMLLKAADRKLNDFNLVKFGADGEWIDFDDANYLDSEVTSGKNDDGLIRSRFEKTDTGIKLIGFIGYSE